MKMFSAIRTLLLVGAVAVAAPHSASAGGDWNDKGIAWVEYEAGLAQAKRDKKPVLLVFFTEWCPHCTTYSKVFHDDKIVEKSKSFVMVRLDKDKNAALSQRYNADGEYIPRTYFLSSDGTLVGDLTAGRAQYKYFYDTVNPASLLAGMERALEKLR